MILSKILIGLWLLSYTKTIIIAKKLLMRVPKDPSRIQFLWNKYK
jgi:hypothetical protein